MALQDGSTSYGIIIGWISGWIGGLIGGWISGWIDGWIAYRLNRCGLTVSSGVE